MNPTPLIRPYFMRRIREIAPWLDDVEGTQRRQLAWLLARGRQTRYGSEHGFGGIRCYEDYRDRVAPASYRSEEHTSELQSPR